MSAAPSDWRKKSNQETLVTRLQVPDRFAGKTAHAIAEIMQRENPGFKYILLQPDLKTPLAGSNAWKDCTDDLSLLVDENFAGYGLGVVLGGLPYFAIDVDIKRGKHGATNLCKWLKLDLPANATEEDAATILIDFFDTLIVRTSSRGLHIYLRHEFDFRVAWRNRPKDCDFGSGKGYFVAPGTHTEAGADTTGKTATGTYEVITDREIALAPQAILEALVDQDAPRETSAAVGDPVPMFWFKEVIAYIDPNESYSEWFDRANSLRNTKLVNDDGSELEDVDAVKLDLWLQFCRGELYKGSKDTWRDSKGKPWKHSTPPKYDGDEYPQHKFENDTNVLEGGKGWGSLVYTAEGKGTGYKQSKRVTKYRADQRAEDNLHEFDDDIDAEDSTSSTRTRGLMNANDYMKEDIQYRHVVYNEDGRGLIPADGIVGIISPYGSGKSTLMDALGYSLATGLPLLGKFEVERRFLVSCPLEDEPGSHDRMRAWCMEQFGVAEMPDPSWHQTWKHPLAIDNPVKLKAFAGQINEVRMGRPLALTVDTWQALISGIGDGQNDDGKIMGIVNQNLKSILRECSDSNSRALAIIAAHPPKAGGHYADESQLSWAGVGGTSNDATGIVFVINVPGSDEKRLWVEKCRGERGRYDACRFRLQTAKTGRLDRRGEPKLGMLPVIAGASHGFGEDNNERHKARRVLMLDCLVKLHEAGTTGRCVYSVADLVAAWKADHPEDKKLQQATLSKEITGTLFKGLRNFRSGKWVVEYQAADKRGQTAKFEIKTPKDNIPED